MTTISDPKHVPTLCYSGNPPITIGEYTYSQEHRNSYSGGATSYWSVLRWTVDDVSIEVATERKQYSLTSELVIRLADEDPIKFYWRESADFVKVPEPIREAVSKAIQAVERHEERRKREVTEEARLTREAAEQKRIATLSAITRKIAGASR